ncbi:MAG: hypothetical protein IV089_08400 [Thiobacillus sp.]|nr:hypothetical protein [Thiobacillus sp.]
MILAMIFLWPGAPADSVPARIVAMMIAGLLVMSFCADAAAGTIQCAVKALELTRVDDAIRKEVLFHGTNAALFMHQLAEFVPGQIS